MEQKKKYHLEFVNEDKPFTVSNWTFAKHEEVLKKVAKIEKDNPEMASDALDRIYQNYIILRGLKEVDSSVCEADIKTMHPSDRVAIYLGILQEGRKGVLVDDKGNFPKSKKTKRVSKK
ncbi:hypothetical protein KAX02_01490 [candidate division WOR-3 bacterium]|nr:hypothetical protein [candidate division WOR-3 bacterium]